MSAPTTRRDLFGASAAMLLLAAPAAVPAKAANLDSELLDACAAFDDLERQIKEVWRLPVPIEEEEAREAAEEPLKVLQGPLLDRICTLKATTPAGCIARARSWPCGTAARISGKTTQKAMPTTA